MPNAEEVSKTNEKKMIESFEWNEYNWRFERKAFEGGLSIVIRNLDYSYAEWRLIAMQYGISAHRMWKIWLLLVKVAKNAYYYESQDGNTSIKPLMTLREREIVRKWDEVV